jgi:hypothetical protein
VAAGRRRAGRAFWPSDTQVLLLRTALGQGAEASTAWAELRPRLDFENLEAGSFGLLPLVYRSLTDAGVDEPLLPRLKGIYRNTWYKSNVLLERVAKTAEALDAASVPAIVVGGPTLGARYYPEVGLRPSPLVDLLVEESDRTRAAAVLGRTRWARRPDIVAPPGGPTYFSDTDGHFCALRSTLTADFVLRGTPDETYAELWQSAERQEVRDVPVTVLGHRDQLLATCVLGARRGPTPNVLWVADAAMVLRAGADTLDWAGLLRAAQARGQSWRLAQALRYVLAFPGTAVPAEVAEEIGRMHGRARERLEFSLSSGSLDRLGGLPALVAEHLGATADRSLLSTVGTFPVFLRDRWQLRHAWQLPVAGGRRAVRSLRRARAGAR